MTFTRILQFGPDSPHLLNRLAADPLNARRLLRQLQTMTPFGKDSRKSVFVFPADWLHHNPQYSFTAESTISENESSVSAVVLLNGRYYLRFDDRKIVSVVENVNADILSFTVSPSLQAGRELVRLMSNDRVAGFRRLYEDVIEPASFQERPHVVFFKRSASDAIDEYQRPDIKLADFAGAVRRLGLRHLHFHAGGQLLDLESETGFAAWRKIMDKDYPSAVDQTAAPQLLSAGSKPTVIMIHHAFKPQTGTFRMRHLFSYARLGKRMFDILVSVGVLLILLPLLAVIAVLVKVTSPGPVFYGARRQGLHGIPFDCLKFRTMIVQADAYQNRLRAVNQVDGPQFKIENDPRISGIGKFLRDTCIDELPQFINVLAGQMSVVGPRPSPASENESCPSWRDARLSVRPGITGLWQVCRTRRSSMDFQEWVYYDTKYVKNLSFGLDMVICFRTAQKLIGNFLDQFG